MSNAIGHVLKGFSDIVKEKVKVNKSVTHHSTPLATPWALKGSTWVPSIQAIPVSSHKL